MPEQGPTRLGRNITLTPKADLRYGQDTRGTPELTFTADVRAKDGRTFERRVVARGRAHDALVDAVRIGERITVRGFYDRASANDDEVVTAICLPRIDLRKRSA